MANDKILEVKDLSVSFNTYAGEVKAVRGVSFELNRGETLAFVGESGCGKTVTAKSILRLLKPPFAVIKEGSKITCDGKDVLSLNKKELCEFRGDEVSMIFQDPMTSLNPTMTVGKQIMESLRIHRHLDKKQAREEAIKMLKMVNIPSPEKRIDSYPHEMSGGMRQRVMIAMALACSPKILIADEPTTALDVTIQAQILELMKKIQQEEGMSILLITHDLGVVAEMCTRVIVMYAGEIVEEAPVEVLFNNPTHPYTEGLIASVPKLGSGVKVLPSIPGSVPDLSMLPKGCRFAPRCKYATERCHNEEPDLFEVSEHQKCRCWLRDPHAGVPQEGKEEK